MVEYREAKNYIRVLRDGKPSLHLVAPDIQNIPTKAQACNLSPIRNINNKAIFPIIILS